MKTLLFIFITMLIFSGCATKNPAYSDFEESPCACFENIKEGLDNV